MVERGLMRTCQRCGGPRQGGRGRRLCEPCAVIRKAETQEQAMERFRERNPNYWRRYYQEER